MTTLQFVAIISAIAINTAVPGPAIIHVLSRSTAAGLAAGFRVSAGIAVGSLTLASVAGMVMLGALTISEQAFATMKWAGALALALLGLLLLRNAGKSAQSAVSPVSRKSTEFGTGLFLAVSIPANLLFLLALLPQLLPADLRASDFAAVLCAVVVGTLLPTKITALVGARACWLGGARWIERASALSMLGFAGLTIIVSV